MKGKNEELAVWRFRPSHHTVNFGDELGPKIVQRLGFKVRLVERITEADLVTIGSILGLVNGKLRPDAKVWGSGFILPTDAFNGLRKNQFLAVRGELTRRKLGLASDVVMGEPALLTSMLWEEVDLRPKYRIGFVQHYADTSSYSWPDKIIHSSRPVDEVVQDIASCSTIVSSSLHGYAVARSFGIPALRLHCPRVIGDEFKWVDFESGWNDRSLSQVEDDLIKALDSI